MGHNTGSGGHKSDLDSTLSFSIFYFIAYLIVDLSIVLGFKNFKSPQDAI